MQTNTMALPTEKYSPPSLEALDDEALMLRYARGDEQAFAELFHRHKTTVYNFMYRFLPYSTQVDDVFQTVFLRVIKNRRRYRRKAKFSTWLYAITRSVCIDTIRSNRNEPPKTSDETVTHYIACNNPTPFEFTAERETQAAIHSIIQSLPQEQREILLWRELTDLTFAEIAQLAGICPNTAKSRLRYALLTLRRQLENRGINA